MTCLKLVKRYRVDSAEWFAYCKASPHATFFHTPMWSEAFCCCFGNMKQASYMLQFSDGVRVLFPAVQKRLPLGLARVTVSMPASTYGGWITTDTLKKEHVLLLLDHVQSHKDLLMRENPYDPDLEEIEVPGAALEYTHSVNLSPGYERIYALSGCNHRNAVRNARRLGVCIEEAQAWDVWERYYTLYQHSILRWKEKKTFSGVHHSLDLFHALFSLDADYRKLWIAKLNGTIIAGILCFYWNTHAVVWHGAGLSDYFNYRPNNLLYDHAIRHACEKGFAWLDCNPSGENQGVRSFKKSLGATALRSRVIQKRSVVRRIVDRVRGVRNL